MFLENKMFWNYMHQKDNNMNGILAHKNELDLDKCIEFIKSLHNSFSNLEKNHSNRFDIY